MPSANVSLPILTAPVEAPVAPTARLRVTLVRAPMVYAAKTYALSITPPLGMAYLAATLLEAGHEVDIVEAIVEGKDRIRVYGEYAVLGLTDEEIVARIDPATQVIGIGCMFSQDWPANRKLIRAIRASFPDALIVVGGEHITALPEYSVRDCPELDVCVLGEGEETLIELLAQGHDRARWRRVAGLAFLDGDEFVRTERRQRIREVEEIPYPAWHLFPIENYLSNSFGPYRGRTLGVLATRGCPYKCTFCSNLGMYGQLWIARSPDDVLDEIEYYVREFHVENIDFYDLTMIIRKEWIIEFCQKLEERGLKITWQLPVGTRSETVDEDVAAALYRSGCRNITYAPESGSVETLKIIKKQVHLDRLVDSIRMALRQKLVVRVNLIVGFPHETRWQVIQTILFGWRLALLGVHDTFVYCFSPYPGTELFDELRKEGRIAKLNDDYFYSLVIFRVLFAPTRYCRNVRGWELIFWRVVGMCGFYGLSFVVRPWRIFESLVGIIRNRSNTYLEFRLGVLWHERLKGRRRSKVRPVPQPSAVISS